MSKLNNMCPSGPGFQALVNHPEIGMFEAMKDWMENDGEVRSVEVVLAKLRGETISVKPIKPGVPELFESNPELANAVYEAVGIGKFRVTLGKELNPEQKIGSQGEPIVKKFEVLDENKKIIGTVTLDIAKKGAITAHPKLTTIGKGYGQELYQILSLTFGAPVIEWGPHNISKSPEGKKLWSNLEKKGLAKAKYKWDDDIYLRGVDLSQQNQQAQQLYSQYLDTIFPDSKVKDIVYHVNKTGTVSPQDGKAFYSTSLGSWLIELEEMKGNRNPVLINITNPTEVSSEYEFTDKAQKFRESGLGDEYVTPDEVRKKGTDSVIGRDSGQGINEKTYVTYNSSQVYQLGTKQDIERFKEFVKSPEGRTTSPETDELSLYLSNKMNENFKISNPKLKGAPSIDDIVTRHVPTSQTDIDNKKEEC